MTGSQDDTTGSLLHSYSNFSSWRGSQTYIYHIHAHSQQGPYNGLSHHLTRNAGIATNHYCIGVYRFIFLNVTSICGCKTHNIKRVQTLPHSTANGPSD